MSRRSFCLTFVGVLIAPGVAIAQSSKAIRRIGWLMAGEPLSPAEIEEVNAPLRALGWIEGQNLLIERRYANNRAELLRPLAEELVRLHVELIVSPGTNATLAARSATATIPIVMYSSGDPVAAGLVASLARPGGNVTGSSLLSPEANAKRLSLLRELMPAVQRVGELVHSANPIFRAMRKDLEQAYWSLGAQPIFVEVTRASQLEDAVANVVRQRAQVLHVPNDDLFVNNGGAIMRAALRYALPTVVDTVALLEAGGLLYYNFSETEVQRRGAAFIDRILRGAKPGDLPVEQVTQFELGINLKTANALGITIPQSLLLRADPDRVIR